MVSRGKRVRISFDLTVDGRLIKSISTNKPFCFIQGLRKGNDIPVGLEKAIKGMKVGDRRKIVLKSKEGYGIQDPKSMIEMPKSRFPKKDHIVGKSIVSVDSGKHLAKVSEVRKNTLMLDFNHPFAGKELHYDVFIVGIEGEVAVLAKKA